MSNSATCIGLVKFACPEFEGWHDNSPLTNIDAVDNQHVHGDHDNEHDHHASAEVPKVWILNNCKYSHLFQGINVSNAIQ